MRIKPLSVCILLVITLFICSCKSNNTMDKGLKNDDIDIVLSTDTISTNSILEASSTTASCDYSSFTGEWFCEETTTYVTLEVDQSGNISGFIMSVVGNHVPSSDISGVIENNILTSRLYLGDEYSEEGDMGSFVLSFDDPVILKGTVTLTKPGFEIAEGDMSFQRYDLKKPNPYFFDDSVTEQTYTGKIATDEITQTDAVLHLTEIAELSDSVVYEFRLDKIAGFPADRLILGYFDVDAYSIWKVEPTENNLEQIMTKGAIPYDESSVVCLKKGVRDILSPDEPGWHHYVTVKGDVIEYHSYDNQVESGYYETFIWEKGKGLIYYKSGYGAGKEELELTIKE